MAVNYTPQFVHPDFVNFVDRVDADVFNGRFHALEGEFARISDVVKQISSALDALEQRPPPTEQRLTLAPLLTASADPGWQIGVGEAAKRPSPATDANGIMNVELPNRTRIRRLRVLGRNSGNGTLRVTLVRQSLTGGAGQALNIIRVFGTGDPFDASGDAAGTDADVVDPATFKYFITAQLNNAGPNDTVALFAFQITHIAQ